MDSTQPFIPWPKIPRLNRTCTITEKLDGTNASIFISDTGEFLVGSRSRWITPQNDNYGFAAWAYKNKDELMLLGAGHHFGEWWGVGIQRRYNVDQKIFSLFNTKRWTKETPPPACCRVVPVIAVGMFSTQLVESCLNLLKGHGSIAAPGFMRPEGLVVYHHAANQYLKVTIEKDEEPKGQTGE